MEKGSKIFKGKHNIYSKNETKDFYSNFVFLVMFINFLKSYKYFSKFKSFGITSPSSIQSRTKLIFARRKEKKFPFIPSSLLSRHPVHFELRGVTKS